MTVQITRNQSLHRTSNNLRLLVFLLLFVVSGQALAERIKDIASVAGVRANQLIGYGLIVGLDGSSDRDNDSSFLF